MRAEGQCSAKTRVTAHTHPPQVTISKAWNENSPIDVHHQWPKNEEREWLSQSRLSPSIQHSASENKQTQMRGVLQRTGVEKLLLQALKQSF